MKHLVYDFYHFIVKKSW